MWTLRYDARPVGANQQTRFNRGEDTRFRREWREAFAWRAIQQRIPRLDAIEVETWCEYPNRRDWLDVGNAYPSVKCAIDGLVDAGVIPNDKDPYLQGLIFRQPRLGELGLVLVVRPVLLDRPAMRSGSPSSRSRPRRPTSAG